MVCPSNKRHPCSLTTPRQIRLAALLIVSLLSGTSLFAQLTVRGRVVDEKAAPIGYATVVVRGTRRGVLTNGEGLFVLSGLPLDTCSLQISYLGYQTRVVEVLPAGKPNLNLEIALLPDDAQLGEVKIVARSAVRELNERPLAISAIDFSEAQTSNIEAAALLDRAGGVRIRQSGGVGSEANITIQGAQGNAVRRYYDGLPARFLPAGLDIVNLPVNRIDRVEIYRGVTPLDVGTDALGGGINVVSKQPYQSKVDAAYQVGSFNAHRLSLGLFKAGKRGFFAGVNGFINYADNDYEIDAHDFNETTRRAENIIQARRFHDRYRGRYADAVVGIRDRKWAEQLRLSVMYNDIYDEIQNGVVFNPVRPAGEIFNERSGVNVDLDYRFSSNDDRWRVSTKTNYGNLTEFIRDSTDRFYNWRGEVLATPNNTGTDIVSAPVAITLDRRILLQRTTGSVRLGRTHELTASNLYVGQQREGRNAFIPAEFDPFRNPATLTQNYAGLAWDNTWPGRKLTTTLTYKYYHYAADATSLEDATDGQFERNEVANGYHGGNAAIKFQPNQRWLFRASYEYAYRLPEEAELFGNQSTIRSNINLRPERGDNFNLGLRRSTDPERPLRLTLEANGFYRYQRDRIILLATGFDLAQFFNEEQVEISGLDGSARLEVGEHWRFNGSATFQDVRIRSALVAADRDLIGTRLPNLPPLFARFDAGYGRRDLLSKGDRLGFTWFYDFTDEFSSVREAEARRNVANFVPTQNVHSCEATYAFADIGLVASARVNNVFGDDVYDNFRQQRPGRNFQFKLTYALP